MRVGVVSDTHGLLRTEVLERFAAVDHIVHAGDIGRPEIIPRLEALAPTTAIRGNIDTESWAGSLRTHATLALFGRVVHVLHDLNELDLDPAAAGVDVVVSGHSHRPNIERRDGVLYLNPGSAGPRRFKLPVSVAVLDLENGVEARIVKLLP